MKKNKFINIEKQKTGKTTPETKFIKQGEKFFIKKDDGYDRTFQHNAKMTV